MPTEELLKNSLLGYQAPDKLIDFSKRSNTQQESDNFWANLKQWLDVLSAATYTAKPDLINRAATELGPFQPILSRQATIPLSFLGLPEGAKLSIGNLPYPIAGRGVMAETPVLKW